MTKIMFFGTRDYEKEMALNWGKNNVGSLLLKGYYQVLQSIIKRLRWRNYNAIW